MNVENLRSLRAAAHRLAERCPVIARAVAIGGTPPWRCDEVGYPGLARTIVYQQLSGRAAATIWSRVQALLPVVSPSAVLAASSDDLRGCGLSRGKVEHLRSVAEAVASGALNFARVASDRSSRGGTLDGGCLSDVQPSEAGRLSARRSRSCRGLSAPCRPDGAAKSQRVAGVCRDLAPGAGGGGSSFMVGAQCL